MQDNDSNSTPWNNSHSQPVAIPNAAADSTSEAPAAAGFASSLAAFYPNSGSNDTSNEAALFPRRSQGISSIANATSSGPVQVPSQMSLLPFSGSGSSSIGTSASNNLMAAFSSSKLRRPSFLASNLHDDGEEITTSGMDSPSERRNNDGGNISEDVDMDMMLNEDEQKPSSSSSHSQYSRATGYIPHPIRARSHSQSTSVTTRSPPWPSSPPRSSQHFLARATSEQQQALQASATSASNAMFMIPTPYRNSGQKDDIIVQNGPSDDADEEDEYNFGGSDSGHFSRPFNSMNPQQLRSSGLPSRSSMHSTRPSSRSSVSQEPMAMEDSSGHSLSSLQPSGHSSSNDFGSVSMEKSASAESNDPMSRIDSGLRASRSSPSLFALRDDESRNGRFPDQTMPTTPPPLRSPNSATPFSQQPLRRSQSASHRLNGFSSFANIRPTAFSTLPGPSVPHTAPLDGSFRVMRANSFSGHPSAASKTTSAPAPSSGSSSSNSASLANASVSAMDQSMNAARGRREHMRSENEREGKHRNLSQSSGSDSNQPSSSSMQPRVVKRAVNHKKGSLMPKSKDHLRIISQLRLETGEFEVASEAALHRISQSTPAPPAFSAPRAGKTSSQYATQQQQQQQQHMGGITAGNSSGFGHSSFVGSQSPNPALGAQSDVSQGRTGHNPRHHRPSSSGGNRPTIPMPTRNRFPESAVEDEDEGDFDSSGSDLDYGANASEAEAAPYASGNEMSGVGEDLEDASSNAGDTVSGFQAPASAKSAWMLRDPANNKRDRPGMDMDLSPSSALGWSANTASRPGKRKMNDTERFEPYNSAFKRRAVSPAASVSSVSLSPLLTNTNPRDLPLPNASTLTSLGPAAQISSSMYNQPSSFPHQQQQPMLGSVPPSPIVGTSGSWLNSTARSRGSSPAPSMSSSAGASRRWHGPMTEEEREKNKVDLGKMNLG